MISIAPHILAASDDALAGKVAFVVIAIVIWGIGALSKQAGKATAKQKERLRQVRESIERAHGQQPNQQAGQPVTLDSEIARRLPPMIPQRPQQVPRRPVPAAGRPATNYNQMADPRYAPTPAYSGRQFPTTQQPPPPMRPAPPQKAPPSQKKLFRRGPATPPPIRAAAPPVPEVILEAAPARTALDTPRPAARAPTVSAVAIKRWATPATLRQQFVLTEIFQPPLALREERW